MSGIGNPSVTNSALALIEFIADKNAAQARIREFRDAEKAAVDRIDAAEKKEAAATASIAEVKRASAELDENTAAHARDKKEFTAAADARTTALDQRDQALRQREFDLVERERVAARQLEQQTFDLDNRDHAVTARENEAAERKAILDRLTVKLERKQQAMTAALED